MNHDQLWMIFPRTLVAVDKQFPDEEACRAHSATGVPFRSKVARSLP
jgi:hypothetical protein